MVLVREWRGNLNLGGVGEGGFLVAHGVVGAAAGGDATCVQVDEEGDGGGDAIAREVENQLGAWDRKGR